MSSLQKKAIRPGDIKVFKIFSSNGASVDLSGSIGEFYYYESILSNTVTATVLCVDTGFEASGNDSRIRTSGVIDNLQLTGGEEVEFEVMDNNEYYSMSERMITSAIGDADRMYIKSIKAVANIQTKKSYIIELVSREYWLNEEIRVTRRYDGNPGTHVEDILKNLLDVSTFKIEQSSYDYNFIGNSKKPLYTCTWLASKSSTSETASDDSKKGTLLGATAGFFFYQTRDQYNFVSIDTLNAQSVRPGRDFIYNNTGKEVLGGVGGRKVNVLSSNVGQQIDIATDLSLGVYNNKSLFFDPYSLSFKQVIFNYDDNKKDKVKLLNTRPTNPEKRMMERPSRLMFTTLDVGTLPTGGVLKTEVEEPEFTTRTPESMVQSIMRYNELFRTKINIIIPADFSIRAGDVVNCTFVNLDTNNSGGSQTLSGKFIVANICHKITSEQSLSSLDIVRDSLGEPE